jgi:UDP-galactopyranose mutase
MVNFVNDVMCFSHLRWKFVFQRPQHLMSRCAERSRVYYVEEPLFEGNEVFLKHSICPQSGVHVVIPTLPAQTQMETAATVLQELLKDLVQKERIQHFIAWYYTPMALEFTAELTPEVTVYDCMDELSAFANAPMGMLRNERKLFERAHLIFTGGQSLYEAKRSKHAEVHLFPSSVDVGHFSKALDIHDDPPDQKVISHPRVGYAGVIDERMDLDLISYLADGHTDWQIVLLGPIVKIDPSSVPDRANIHLLGMKNYQDLPAYLSGWDVAVLPFAQNEATRFISPTKTPEYLAAGLPVVSTPIRDVERPYGKLGLVSIGRSHEDFVKAVEQQIWEGGSPIWQSQVRSFLHSLSWDRTWSGMERLICRELTRNRPLRRSTEAEQVAVLNSRASAACV